MTSRRRVPLPGAPVTVIQLAARTRGTIAAVEDGCRRIVVETEAGERMTFSLHPATGRFMHEGRQTGARLRLEEWD